MKHLLRLSAIALVCSCNLFAEQSGAQDREYTIRMMQRIVDPVLKPLSENKLTKILPRRDWETTSNQENKAYIEREFHSTYLQAFGRSLSGLSLWLSLKPDDSAEGELRKRYSELARSCIINATDPKAADYMFEKPTIQSIVHIAYLAYPLLIAPDALWEPLSDVQKEQLLKALKAHRQFNLTWLNNWTLFRSIIECAIWRLSGSCEMKHIDLALKKHKEWYLGDGVYGDGKDYHCDYYNSYVIQPLLLETLKTCKMMGHAYGKELDLALTRANRYAEIQEHMISPEGTFPVVGRSSTYRIAVFQHLGYVSARFGLPKTLSPGGTRAAMTAVIKKMMEAPGTFDENGFLYPGIVGYQEEARDYYNFTGALYMCSMGLSHLGIPADAPFWTAPAEPWFQQKVWSGKKVPNQSFIKK